jgi:hypothetical protein
VKPRRFFRGLALTTLVAGVLGCGKDETRAVTYAELVRACIASTACGVMPYPRVLNCVEAYYDLHSYFGLGPIYDAIYRCVNAAGGSCSAVSACFGARSCDASFSPRCEGNQAVSCDTLSGQTVTYNCAEAGLTCTVISGAASEAKCSAGSCTTESGRTCEGTRLLSCSRGVTQVVECAARGRVCGKSMDGVFDCVGSGSETCTSGALKRRCEGAVAVSCVNGQVSREDCSQRALDRGCRDGACVPAGSECVDELDRCQASELQACLDGRWETYDCAVLGLGSCQGSAQGAACGPR